MDTFWWLIGLALVVAAILGAFWIGRKPDEARAARDKAELEAKRIRGQALTLWERFMLWRAKR